MNFDLKTKYKKNEIFFNPKLPKIGLFQLDLKESRHCVKVLRLSENNIISVIDGKGNIAKCRIIKANSKATELEIIKFNNYPNPIGKNIHIAISPTKNMNRFEWFLEKTVELGIGEITPIISENSEREKLNFQRLEKKIITSLKQSQNLFLPKINPLVNFKEFINLKFNNSQKFICHNGNSTFKYLNNELIKKEIYIIVIGPEGGFSEKEIQDSESFGFIKVLLGSSRLRTETAGIIACHTIHLFSS